jgi:carbamoyl-phosphate synthase large subunit
MALIPARGGSKRIPRKNIRLFGGRPVIAWSIAAARDSGLFDRIVCSTDDEEIAAVAEAWGAEAPFRRPAALSDDHATTLAVVQHALEWAEAQGMPLEAICFIYPASPFVTASGLTEAYERLQASGAQFCLPIARFPAPIQRAIRRGENDRLEMFQPDLFNVRSQDLEPAYFDVGQFCWGRPEAFRRGLRIFGPDAVGLETPLWRAVDIDTPEDWLRAERLWNAFGDGGRGSLQPAETRALIPDEGGPAPIGPFNVLITSVSHKLSCIREVRRGLVKLNPDGRVYGADVDPDCLGRDFVDVFWRTPRLDSLSLDALIDYCRAHHIRVIVPTRDGELAWFAERRSGLMAAGITVMVPDPDIVALCLDKLRFARELGAMGYPAIPAYEDAASCSGERLVVKERFGAGSLGVKLDLAATSAAAAAEGLSRPIFQPFVAGLEYSVDTFTTSGGVTKGAVARRRDRVVRGEAQITTAADKPEMEALCARAATAIRLRGHAVWQVIEDPHGGPHIVECNCRIGGASSLSLSMGLDSFYWAFREAAGDDLSRLPFIRSPVNLRQIRIPHDIIEADPGL